MAAAAATSALCRLWPLLPCQPVGRVGLPP
jgi:hypothetical protein